MQRLIYSREIRFQAERDGKLTPPRVCRRQIVAAWLAVGQSRMLFS
jgi:hypothetical protein